MYPLIIIILILFLIILCFLIYYYYTVNYKSYKPLIGGCAGTRYGCCPDKNTPKHDNIGSNC